MLRGIDFLIQKGIEHRRRDSKCVYHHVSAGIIDDFEIDISSISVNDHDYHAEEKVLKPFHTGIIVIRIVGQRNFEKLGMSKPCKDCSRYLKTCGRIKNVYYSDHVGIIVKEKIEELQNDHLSGRNRKN